MRDGMVTAGNDASAWPANRIMFFLLQTLMGLIGICFLIFARRERLFAFLPADSMVATKTSKLVLAKRLRAFWLLAQGEVSQIGIDACKPGDAAVMSLDDVVRISKRAFIEFLAMSNDILGDLLHERVVVAIKNLSRCLELVFGKRTHGFECVEPSNNANRLRHNRRATAPARRNALDLPQPWKRPMRL